ncbi:uncharacterized protein WM277_020263 isoform 1-T2 [Molossus nigricans]
MAPKRAAASKPSDDETNGKMLTIQEKVKLLDMIKDGKKIMEVARHYDLNESTVRSIHKDEKNIYSTATVSFNKEAKRIVTIHNKFIAKMESALAVWISDSARKTFRWIPWSSGRRRGSSTSTLRGTNLNQNLLLQCSWISRRARVSSRSSRRGII